MELPKKRGQVESLDKFLKQSYTTGYDLSTRTRLLMKKNLGEVKVENVTPFAGSFQ